MNNRRQRKLAALLLLLLLFGLVGSAALWLRAQRRQYALNRALIAALVRGDDGRALALVKAGADPNTRSEPTPVPSLPEMVQQMLHRSTPPTNDSLTALMIACGKRKVFLTDDSGQQTMAYAQSNWSDDVQLVQAMLTHGANVNAKGVNGLTPLIEAVNPPRPDTVRLLLEHGARVNAQDEDGMSALYSAVDVQDKVIVRQLLAHGANPNVADRNGVTPLMVAQAQHCRDLIVLLKQAGAKEPANWP